MTRHLVGIALAAASLLTTQACYDKGSCSYTTPDGYTYCLEYPGTEYNQTVSKENCSDGRGTWSANACTHDHALGNCLVANEATGTAQTLIYTYYANTSASTPATALTVETACGLVGGIFTAE